jgi:cysteine desulfurase
MARVYLDYNATSLPRAAAKEAVSAALLAPANASSVHTEGRAARAIIEDARRRVAALVGADPEAITFTSGATEANVAALSPELELEGKPVRCDVLIVSSVEHQSVRAGGRFGTVEFFPVDENGIADVQALQEMLDAHRAQKRRAFVSVMAANNETGALQPLRTIAERVRDAGGVFHTDAVQVAGKIPFSVAESGADLVSISSHKLGGPQGAGALIARHAGTRVPPLMTGGGQEQGRRAGTENAAAIAGFGAAASEAGNTLTHEGSRLGTMRARLEDGIRTVAADVVIFSDRAARLPNTTYFSAPDVSAETAIIAFDLEGIALSTGSACSSGKVAASETLKAMRVAPELIKGAMRVSMGWNTTDADVTQFLNAFAKVYTSLNKRGARAA